MDRNLCPTGKMPYPSFSDANKALKRMHRSGYLSRSANEEFGPGKFLAPYRCQRCNKVHLGNSSRDRVRGTGISRQRKQQRMILQEAFEDA